MIIVSTETIANKTIIDTKGIVTSSIVQSRNIGKDFLSGLKSIVGGELSSYTEMLEDSKEIALARIKEQATHLNANAIVGFRFTLTSGQGTSELIAFGTAVLVD